MLHCALASGLEYESVEVRGSGGSADPRPSTELKRRLEIFGERIIIRVCLDSEKICYS